MRLESKLKVVQLGWNLEDNNMEDDKRTMILITEIANSIHPMLQFEEDYPSKYPDSKPDLEIVV